MDSDRRRHSHFEAPTKHRPERATVSHHHDHHYDKHSSEAPRRHRHTVNHAGGAHGPSSLDGSSRSRRSSVSTREEPSEISRQGSHHSAGDDSNRSSSSTERHIREYISSIGLPLGLLPTVLAEYKSCESRIWLIENSTLMKVKDSHRAKIGSTLEHSMKEDGVSRWKELIECIEIHTKMAAHSKCVIPTKFWLVNDPGPNVGPQRFNIGWNKAGSDPDLLEDEIKQAKHIMSSVTLDAKENPLAKQIRKIERGIEQQVTRLEAKGKHITVTIFTEGTPTDETGRTGVEARKELLQSLISLSTMPVRIIVRLCTDNEQVTEWFNTIDTKMDHFDVLDDFWGEAMEVYMHNPWLTYGIGLHRLREAGMASDLMGELDDTKMSLDQVHLFCHRFFVGKSSRAIIPHPRHSWREFMDGLVHVLKHEKPQWNSVKKKLTPWIDLKMLETMYGPKTHIPSRSCQDPPADRKHHHEPQQQQQHHHQQQRQPKQQHHQQQHHQPQQRRTSTVSNGSNPPAATPANSGSLTLEEILQRWSHASPNDTELRPLQVLLVTVPSLFPPTNPKVEPHEYYSKWKEFEKEAFNESGDELNDLLKRAVRKTKFFLHPDKLPKDLTDNQTLLFRTVWDVIQDSEAKTLG